MIPITEILIRYVGIQKTIDIMCKPTQNPRATVNEFQTASKFLKALILGVRGTVWKGNCLSRSIVLQRLLRLNGVKTKLCVGVRNKPKFKAHAWIEYKGRPLNAGKRVRHNYQLIEQLQQLNSGQFT